MPQPHNEAGIWSDDSENDNQIFLSSFTLPTAALSASGHGSDSIPLSQSAPQINTFLV